MKLNRIDNNKICYILNQDDLDRYNLTIKDLAYGNEKSKALMNNLIEQLSREINFNPDNSNLSVELIPLESGELKIEVSAIDHDDELNILFSNLIKEYEETANSCLDFYTDDDFPTDKYLTIHTPSGQTKYSKEISLQDAEEDCLDNQKNISPIIKTNATIPNIENTSFVQAFEFKNLDQIIHIAHIIKRIEQLKTSLYKDNLHSKYLLLLENLQRSKEIVGICNLIMENGGKPNNRYTIKSYCEEHLDLIIKENALEQLSLI